MPDRDGEPRINERIRVPEVRVIDPDGEQVGILPTYDAQLKAKELGLDLVEVAPKSRPPVCKIMDYGRHKYLEKKKAAEARKKQSVIEIKEMKFRPKTDQHDFDHKTRRIRRFLEDGNKAKATIRFRGREMVHKEVGIELMQRIAKEVEDIAVVEHAPQMEGRAMVMVLGPDKKKN